MKTYKKLLGFVFLIPFIGCSPENDIKISEGTDYRFYEEFKSFTQETEGDEIAIEGWTNFAEAGNKKWKQGFYSGTKYAEFTAYTTVVADRNPVNIGWLISPPISMDATNKEMMAFDVAQAYVSSASNSIELLVSKDYDGTNVLAATWVNIPFTKPALNYDTNFDFFSSGIINLGTYTDIPDNPPYAGNIYIAFKYKGSGTNFSLDGTYELDNIRIFNQK